MPSTQKEISYPSNRLFVTEREREHEEIERERAGVCVRVCVFVIDGERASVMCV